VVRGRERYLATLARNLLLMQALDEALDALESAQIPVQPLKGSLFIETLYEGDLGVRPMSDLDLLVPPETVARAAAVLRELGYHQHGVRKLRYSPSYSHHLVFERRRVVIELHHRLATFTGVNGDGAEFFRESEEIDYRGRRVRVARRELQLYFTLLHAALHSFLHHRGWIVDARLHVAMSPGLDIDYIFRVARARNSTRMIRMASSIVDSFFPGTLPVYGDSGWRERGLELLLSRSSRIHSPSVRSVATNLLCIERWRDIPRFLASKAYLRAMEFGEALRDSRSTAC